MTLSRPHLRLGHLLFALALTGFGAVVFAQIEGERGIAPIASTGDFEVHGIHVDIEGPDADTARQSGWKLAQRLAWKALWRRTKGNEGPALSDSTLDGMVSGIEVQQEQIGPTRYIATLGVQFDRLRAGQLLGVTGQIMRSPPLLVIPVLTDGGVSTAFETTTEWQKAWAVFRTGESAIDYVRPAGDGPDAILLNAPQIYRRGRTWWRELLDQYGATDVLMPLARLERSWPGGPITGHFVARYGPDNQYIDRFDMRAANAEQLPQMLASAVARMDKIYSNALKRGVLKPDSSLIIEAPLDALELGNVAGLDAAMAMLPSESGAIAPASGAITVQFDTPDASLVGSTEAAVRGIAGVRSAATTSLALGGTSVMEVSYGGSPEQLRAALEARGYTVTGSGATLRIVRRGAGGEGEGQ